MKTPALKPLPTDRDIFTGDEVMAAIGISDTTLWRLEAQGHLKRAPGLHVRRYSRKTVMAFLNGETVP